MESGSVRRASLEMLPPSLHHLLSVFFLIIRTIALGTKHRRYDYLTALTLQKLRPSTHLTLPYL